MYSNWVCMWWNIYCKRRRGFSKVKLYCCFILDHVSVSDSVWFHTYFVKHRNFGRIWDVKKFQKNREIPWCPNLKHWRPSTPTDCWITRISQVMMQPSQKFSLSSGSTLHKILILLWRPVSIRAHSLVSPWSPTRPTWSWSCDAKVFNLIPLSPPTVQSMSLDSCILFLLL